MAVLGGLLGGCAATLSAVPPGPEVRALADRIDWDAAGDEAARVLSAYLRIDTSNPPGNETEGARFLAAALEREGIPSEIVEVSPGRGSLVARLKGSGAEPPLCLMSHIDVATAEPDAWQPGRGPFSGASEDGQVRGRGALDMKGMGVLELQTLAWLKRLGVPLRRDVVLLAVADEEVGNTGIRHIAGMWDRIGCSHVLNEGGIGIRDAVFPGQTVFGISVADKGVLWVRMTARGAAGHGSVPRPDSAPSRLLDAVAKVRGIRPEPRFPAAVTELLARVGDHGGGLDGFVLKRPALQRSLARGALMKNVATRAMLTDTIYVTGLDTGGNEPNVVPSSASAVLDIRLLPGTRPEDVLARLKSATGNDPSLAFDVILSTPSEVTAWQGDPLYESLARNLVAGRKDAVAGPVLSVGFSDSSYLRQIGVKAFGLVPFEITKEEAETMHGADERVSVANLRRGLSVLYRVVVEVAADLDGPAGAAPR